MGIKGIAKIRQGLENKKSSMKKSITTIVIIAFTMLFINCKKGADSGILSENEITQIQDIIIKNESVDLKLREDSFLGIKMGDSITLNSLVLKKNDAVYTIKTLQYDNLGYIIPDDKTKEFVSQIVITSNKAETIQGIKTGMSFYDFKSLIPNFSIYKSEIDGRFYLKSGAFKYRLSEQNLKGTNLQPKDSLKITELILSK